MYSIIRPADLTAANLRGYGEVDAAAAAELLAHADDLRAIITRARSVLERGGVTARTP